MNFRAKNLDFIFLRKTILRSKIQEKLILGSKNRGLEPCIPMRHFGTEIPLPEFFPRKLKWKRGDLVIHVLCAIISVERDNLNLEFSEIKKWILELFKIIVQIV